MNDSHGRDMMIYVQCKTCFVMPFCQENGLEFVMIQIYLLKYFLLLTNLRSTSNNYQHMAILEYSLMQFLLVTHDCYENVVQYAMT